MNNYYWKKYFVSFFILKERVNERFHLEDKRKMRVKQNPPDQNKCIIQIGLLYKNV